MPLYPEIQIGPCPTGQSAQDPCPPKSQAQGQEDRAMLERIGRERASHEEGYTVAGHQPGRRRRIGNDG